MKTDDLWMEFHHGVAYRFVEWRPAGTRNGVVLIEPQLHVVTLQALSPECFPICIDSRRCVTKEIQIDWATGLATYRLQFVAHLSQTQQSTRKRAQPTGFRNSHNHFGQNRSGHRCLNNWQLDTKEFENAIVRPHLHDLNFLALSLGRVRSTMKMLCFF